MTRWLQLLLRTAMLMAVTVAPATAHIVIEEPWHPVASAYRTMLFMADLKPVSWSAIADAYTGPAGAATSERPAAEFVTALSPELAGQIDTAIAAQDRQALYASTTRALSALIRDALRQSGEAASPGLARRHMDDARALYRALDDFVAQADRPGARTVGLAWLELSNSLGSAGVLERGATSTQAQDFARARSVIEAYLRENFEPATFSQRTRMTPLPESVAMSGVAAEIAPWLPPGTNLNDQNPLPKLVLNAEERGIDETDLPLVAYGDMLFDSPEIFGEPARSLNVACSTCHNRSDINQDFFIPGISSQPGAVDVDGHFFNSIFNDQKADAIDIPSLRGIRFLGPYGRDGRIASLREFTRNVIVAEFAGAEPTPFMLDTLVAYMLEFDFLPNSKIDEKGRLSSGATDAERRGEELFRRPFAAMDGKSCATCHIPSSSFVDRRAHNIGSGSPGYGDALDGAFDTPTILGTRFTAPYFHDGSQPSLASVVAWFDGTFGLGLSSGELADLTAYVEAIGDADEPYETFDEDNTAFRLAWEELTTFASTLDWLLPRRDGFHARLLIDTVATDLAADASVMRNLAAKPDAYRLSNTLADVGVAIAAERWEEAERGWAAFKKMQAELDPEMY